MEETYIVVDVEASPHSESMQLEPSPLSKSSPLSEAPKVVGLKAPLQRQLETLWGNVNMKENFTIFRTPHGISQSKKKLFEPSVISIGPFHHGQKHLRALEEQKRRYLRDFLSRDDNISLDLCISEMKLLETRTRRCYSETFDDLDSDTFVEMMLLDGCFLLEYFKKSMEGDWNSSLEVGWNSHFIDFDLILQENQIPFFIVDKLYELIGFNQELRTIFVKHIAHSLLPEESIYPDAPAETPDTKDCIFPDPPAETTDTIDSIITDPPAEIPDSTDLTDITDSTNSTDSTDLDKIPNPPSEIHHLVHLCYHYLVPNPDKPDVLSSKSFDLTTMFSPIRIMKGFLHRFLSMVLKRRSPHSSSQSLSVALPNSTGNLSSMVIPSATELKQKGLKFIPKSNPKHMLDISFEYGVLKIPRLKFEDSTKPIFASLIAFEHSKYGKEHSPFTSFVAFLDNLVNTPNDVTILQQCGIIENWLGSEEELAHFINQVTEGNFYGSDQFLAKLYMEVNRYSESRWNMQRAILIRDYFSSPWAAISLVAAFILLVLTCVQSFYTVYAYKYPPSS